MRPMIQMTSLALQDVGTESTADSQSNILARKDFLWRRSSSRCTVDSRGESVGLSAFSRGRAMSVTNLRRLACLSFTSILVLATAVSAQSDNRLEQIRRINRVA